MRFIPKHESKSFTLWEDLDGKTIEQVAEWLLTFPKGAVIDARTRRVRKDWSHDEEDCFVLTWDDENGSN